MGPPYYERYFTPEEAHDDVPKIVGLLERNDLAYVVSFFQQARTGAGQAFAWYLSAARVLVQKSAGQPRYSQSAASGSMKTISGATAAHLRCLRHGNGKCCHT